MLITLFTSIPASRTEPDLGLFGYRGDDVSYRKDTNPTYCYRYFRILNSHRRGQSGRSAGDADTGISIFTLPPLKIPVGLFAIFNFKNVDDQNVVMD